MPPSAAAEAARLTTLRAMGVLDTPPEPLLNDLVLLARQIAGTPTALISLVDEDRQWFKARSGLEAAETPRSMAFCAHAIERPDAVMVVPDATLDPRFADNPLVTGPPHIRFYAGAPILIGGHHAIGTICVLDTLPRERFDAAPALTALARQAAAQLELRSAVAVRAAASAEQHRIADAMAQDLDQLWRMAHDLMIVTDRDGRLQAVNPAWESLFGPLPPGGIATPAAYHHPSETAPLRRAEGPGAESFRRHYVDRTGRDRYVSWTLTGNGNTLFGVGRDDTALVEAEETLRQSQKMEAVGQLTGGIAHDFNNLLTIVLGNLDMAGRRLGDAAEPRLTRAIGHARDATERAATLTRRLLAFARRQPLAPRAIDPATQLGLTRALIERAVGDAIEVRVDCAPGGWPVLVDPVQLESALLNLAVNARDAMVEGGRLTLVAANVALAPREAAERRLDAGDYVRFSVTDSGVGMPPEVIARVFEPFFTTKEVGKGTGLGLSQVHGFVVQSGGAVTIDSLPGQGTTVHLWLPRSTVAPREPTASPRLDAGTRMAVPGAGGTRVLVVEDNDALRELVVTTLRDDGYKVLEAHDGASGLALFLRQERAPALVLSDIKMPNMDGIAMTQAIRRRAPAVRVLLMTGYADSVDGVADELLAKPFTLDALLARVRGVVG